MNCPACEAAQENPATGLYKHDCHECKARALANGQAMFDSQKKGYMTKEYKAALTALFGAEGLDQGHKAVKEWSRKIKEAK